MSTGIEWTDETWNPVTGCEKVSPGCENCYAEVMYERFNGKGSFTTVKMHSSRLAKPFHWRRPRKVFVNSMSDLFHKDVSDFFIAEVFTVMALTPHHTYQILTKRPARMRALLSSEEFWTGLGRQVAKRYDSGVGEHPGWSWVGGRSQTNLLENVWLGVSVENQLWADIRVPALLMTPAAVRFLSCEPLLGPVDLTAISYTAGGGTHLDIVNGHHGIPGIWRADAKRIDWVIVGGESGRGARPMHPQWVRTLRNQCDYAGVPFLFKQWGHWTGQAASTDRWVDREPDGWLAAAGGPALTEDAAIADGGTFHGMYRVGKKAAGRELDGRTWDEYPAVVS